MTIRFIRNASMGLPIGTIRTFSPSVEAALIADREAVSTTEPNDQSDIVPVWFDRSTGSLVRQSGEKIGGAVPGDGKSTPGAVLRAAMARTLARDHRPINATRAWTSGEVVVQGAARQNAGLRYIAKGSGTCGATAPTHSNAAGVSDGAVVWCFAGNPKAASGAEVPALQYASAASQAQLTQHIFAATLLTRASLVGGTATVVSGTTIVAPCVSTAPAAGNTSFIGAASKVSSLGGWGIDFYTDAPQIMLNGGTTPAYANVPFQVYVDCRPLHDGNINTAALVNPGAPMLTFPSGSSVRRIRLMLAANDSLSGVRIPAGYSIWPADDRVVATFGGDSLTAGANGFPAELGTSWPQQVGRMLGIDDVRVTALGGTGFISNNSGTNRTSIERIADVTGVADQVLHVYAGNHNDDQATDEAQIAAVKAYVAAFRAVLPTVPIVMFGPDAEQTAPSASQIAADANMARAVAEIKAAGDSNIYWWSIINDPAGVWFSSANASLYGSGDGLHPNQLGIDARAARYGQTLARIIDSIT